MNENLKLGFAPSRRPKYIYCNRSNAGCNWYFVENQEVVPIDAESICGIVLSVDEVSKERRGKDSEKLRIKLSADRLYVLESGRHTEFAKSFLNCWEALTLEERKKPIYIEPKPGDGPTVLFCEVYNYLGRKVRSDLIQHDSPTVKPGSDNPVVQRVKDLVRLTGLPLEQVQEVCRGAGLPIASPDFQDMAQVEKFKTALFTAWAASQGANNPPIPNTGNDTADFVELRRYVNGLATVPM